MVKKVAYFFGLSKIYLVCNVCNTKLFFDDEQEIYTYHCWECPDFDICNTCLKSKSHNHKTYRIDVKKEFKSRLYNTTPEVIRAAMLHHDNLPCLGYVSKNKEIMYEWWGYRKVLDMAFRVGDALVQLGLKQGDIVLICAPNSVEWIIADLACIFHQFVVAPVHYTFDTRSLESIVNDTEAKVVFTTDTLLNRFVSLNSPLLRHFVLLDQPTKMKAVMGIFARIRADNRLWKLTELLQKGRTPQKSYPLPFKPDTSQLFTLEYTSGSTGQPKGVMLHSGAFAAKICSTGSMDVEFAFAPLSHSERKGVLQTMVSGGRTAVYGGDMSDLLLHVRVVQPFSFQAPPRVWNQIYANFNNALALAKAGAVEEDYDDIEADLLQQFSEIFGSRIKMVSTGSAPTSGAVVEFMRRCFKCVVYEGYGIKEAGSISCNNFVDHDVSVKLIDYEEFKTTDLPFPRGEVCAKTNNMASGYFKNPVETAEHFRDGWFHTGDIGQLDKNGYLVLIGRKKHLFKLAQGEFVAPEKLENVFQKSNFVDQILVYGLPIMSFLVSIVVPNQLALAEVAKANGVPLPLAADFSALCAHPVCIEAVERDLMHIAKQAELRSFEFPQAFHLTHIPFTEENGQLTYSNKINRSKISQDYQQILTDLTLSAQLRLDAISNNSNSSSSSGLGLIGGAASVQNARSHTQTKLRALVRQIMGVDGKQEENVNILAAAGCDSLTATQLVFHIKKSFNVDVPIRAIVGEQDINHLARLIDQSRNGGQSYISVPDPPPPKNEKLDASIKPALEQVKSEEWRHNIGMGDVLLTGATGFLGCHILHQLLVMTENKIYCVVRPKKHVDDKNSNFGRVREALIYYKLWDECYADRIVEVAGDISLPRLGLSEEIYDDVCERITTIYHNGAVVNSFWSYDALKPHNVDSTTEVLKIAVTKRLKCVHYISSVSVYSNCKSRTPFTEADFVNTKPKDPYGLSKYWSEMLCGQARERGVPVIIYRPGTISGHTQTGGNNQEAFVNRLLCGISLMRMYPNGVTTEMIPVDYVSSAIVFLSLRESSFHEQVFHLTHHTQLNCTTISQAVASFYGTEVKQKEFDDWRDKISEKIKLDKKRWPNPLFHVLATHLSSPSRQICCSSHRTDAVLYGTPIIKPEISVNILHIYLNFCSEKGIIPPQAVRKLESNLE